DTLSGIARRFGTTVEAMVVTNGIEDPSKLFPGAVLTIPGFEGFEGVLTLQEVALGEDLTSLSLRYNVSADVLARLNRLVRSDRLYVGQSFIIPEPVDGALSGDSVGAFLPHLGETRLEIAVRAGINPWDLRRSAEDSLRLWVMPGNPLTDSRGWRVSLPEQFTSISIEPLPVVQGHTVVLRAGVSRPIRLEGSLGDHHLTFFQTDEGELVALQGIHALAEPGLIDLELRMTLSEDGETDYVFRQPVLVEDGDYGFQYLVGVPEETVDPESIRPEEEFVAALLAPATPDKLWVGSFDYPSRYYTDEFIADFGVRRNYNYGALFYYHTGLDFYGSNVPIYAPSRGVVVFAGPLMIRGNVTYIDHGWGVYSGYFHQAEMFVQEGDIVERGQEIGIVGSTGRSTGPHLHWEIWVGGVPINPLDWVDQGYP
ncbi:MAG: peptidoglycan DD-metalloendopeptidase family protein, partial [Anaerolineales bacterium]|nr:peptidoglycan DD-metalloendopeptidase family protein [Anaerolineales bacterium]